MELTVALVCDRLMSRNTDRVAIEENNRERRGRFPSQPLPPPP